MRAVMATGLVFTVALACIAETTAPATPAPSTPPEESLYRQLSRAVIRLQTEDGKPVASGFFVDHLADSKWYYLVSARHVVEPLPSLVARVPTQRLEGGGTELLELVVPKEAWLFHSDAPRTVTFKGKQEVLFPVDVAVAKIPPPPNGLRIRTLDYCPAPCEKPERDQFLASDPEPPFPVSIWGFPVDIGFTLEEQRPMARTGVIALAADEPYIRTERVQTFDNGVVKQQILRDEKVVLIDAPIFPGNSGGPLLSSAPFGRIKLVGLVSASNREFGFAIAEPVSRVRETLNTAFKRPQASVAKWRPIAERKPTVEAAPKK